MDPKYAEGKIVCLGENNGDFPMSITVAFRVGPKVYALIERIRLKNDPVKIGPVSVPVRRKRVPMLGDVSLGAKVRVAYNPENPNNAWLPDNSPEEEAD